MTLAQIPDEEWVVIASADKAIASAPGFTVYAPSDV